MTAEAWPRVAKLDAPRMVERIAAITGVRLTVEGPCPGGEVGAAYVRWPDGRRSVLSEGRADTAALLDVARAAGVPTARQELSARIDGRRVVVQQRLPGRVPATVDAPLVHAMVELTDRFAGLLADRPDLPAPELYLDADGPGFCLHEPPAGHSRRTARLLGWVHDVAATGIAHADGDDLVHLDLHPGNVLTEGGRITGVVDWDGAGRGDRHFDLVTLLFNLTGTAPHLAPIVADRLTGVHPDRRRAYWAHMSLRQVDWSIRHHDAATVDHWLGVAETGITIT